MTKKQLWLGVRLDDPQHPKFYLETKELRRHCAVFGSTGSGKTVFSKVLIEEAILNDIPVFVIDPQGDLVRLAIRGDPNVMKEHGTPPERAELFFKKASIAIFTPSTNDGIKLIFNPLQSYPDPRKGKKFDPSFHGVIFENITDSVLALVSKQYLSGKHVANFKHILYKTLEFCYMQGDYIQTLEQLADAVETYYPSLDLTPEIEKSVSPLKTALIMILEGPYSALIKDGVPLDFDILLKKRNKKVPLNIIYLNVLPTTRHKQIFLRNFISELYSYALDKGQAECLLFIDEVRDFIPSGTRSPPSKPILKTFFNQARKYKVMGVIATQSPGSIDYEIMGQCNTRAYGRLTVKQDLEKIKDFLESSDRDKLPKLSVGQFLITTQKGKALIKTRWLFTEHGEPIPSERLCELMDNEVLTYFEKFVVKEPETKIKPARVTPTKVQAALERAETVDKPQETLPDTLNKALQKFQSEINQLPQMAHQILYDLVRYEKVDENRPPSGWNIVSYDYREAKKMLVRKKLIKVHGTILVLRWETYFRSKYRHEIPAEYEDDQKIKKILKERIVFKIKTKKKKGLFGRLFGS